MFSQVTGSLNPAEVSKLVNFLHLFFKWASLALSLPLHGDSTISEYCKEELFIPMCYTRSQDSGNDLFLNKPG